MLTSGIIGRVEGFVGDRAKIEIAPGMAIEVVRQAVAQRVDDADADAERRTRPAPMTTTIMTTWSTTPITTRTPCLRSRPVIRPIPETKRTGAIRAGTEAEAVALEKGLAPQRHPHLRCLLRSARRRRRCRLVPKARARPRGRPVRRLPAGREGDAGGAQNRGRHHAGPCERDRPRQPEHRHPGFQHRRPAAGREESAHGPERDRQYGTAVLPPRALRSQSVQRSFEVHHDHDHVVDNHDNLSQDDHDDRPEDDHDDIGDLHDFEEDDHDDVRRDHDHRTRDDHDDGAEEARRRQGRLREATALRLGLPLHDSYLRARDERHGRLESGLGA